MAGLARHQYSVQAKRQALRRTRQGALASCNIIGDLPSTARGPTIGPARDTDCHCGRGGAVGRGCPRVADAPGCATCVWGRLLVWIELRTVCHHTCLPRSSCTMSNSLLHPCSSDIHLHRYYTKLLTQKGWRVVTSSASDVRSPISLSTLVLADFVLQLRED